MAERLREKAVSQQIAQYLRYQRWTELVHDWQTAIERADRWFVAAALRQFRPVDLPVEMVFPINVLCLESALMLSISSLIELHLRTLLNTKILSADQQTIVKGYVAHVLESSSTSVSFRAQLRVTAARQFVNDEQAVAEALYEAGRAAIQQGFYARALVALREAGAYYERHNLIQQQANSLYYIGLICRLQQDTEQAMDMLSYALRFYTQLGDTLGCAKTEREVGLLYQALNDGDNAEGALLSCLERFEALGDGQACGDVWLDVATTYQRQGRLADAEQSLQHAYAQYHRGANFVGVAECLHGQLQLANQQGHTERANQLTSELRALFADHTELAARFPASWLPHVR